MRNMTEMPALVRPAAVQMSLKELALRIDQEHQAAEAGLLQGIESARKAGELLHQAKQQCGYGKWKDWLKANVKFKRTTAWKYMRLFNEWEAITETADVSLVHRGEQLRLPVSIRGALAVLSADADETDEGEPEVIAAAATPPGQAEPAAEEETVPAPGSNGKHVSAPSPARSEPDEEDDEEAKATSAPSAPPKPPAKAAPVAEDTPGMVDPVGMRVPAGLEPTFRSLEKFDAIVSLLRQAQSLIHDLAEGKGGEQYRQQLAHKAMKADGPIRHYCEHISSALSKLKFTRPHASACPYCHQEGKVSRDCRACLGLGWVARKTWEGTSDLDRQMVQAARRDSAEGEA